MPKWKQNLPNTILKALAPATIFVLTKKGSKVILEKLQRPGAQAHKLKRKLQSLTFGKIN